MDICNLPKGAIVDVTLYDGKYYQGSIGPNAYCDKTKTLVLDGHKIINTIGLEFVTTCVALGHSDIYCYKEKGPDFDLGIL